MTPMTDAVQQAAHALKFTENEVTVILVSDGEETCAADPCQAIAELEKLGVNLTVHTAGFGLESAEAKKAREQLQCMAQTTGGAILYRRQCARIDACSQNGGHGTNTRCVTARNDASTTSPKTKTHSRVRQ